MEELIKVSVNDNNEQVVSGRYLHEFLEVKTLYKDRIKSKNREILILYLLLKK